MAWIKKLSWRNVLLILAVIGPGIITASVDNDAGGIATYSIAGARFGYKLLWLLIPIAITLTIVQEMNARLGVVTGKGFADLIRENFGIRITFSLMAILLFVNLANTMAEFAGWAASMEIFGVTKYIAVPVAAILVWLLVVRGRYRFVERVFLAASLVYVCYVISGMLARPDWGAAASQVVSPPVSLSAPYVTMIVALIGTTIAPWMQFYIQSAVVEKGIKSEEYAVTRIDVIVGSIVTTAVMTFIVVACAATLFKSGVGIETAADAALALKPLAGRYASLLFAIGLANASLFAASILPLSTAYSVSEGIGWEGGVDKDLGEAPHFHAIYTGLIIIGAATVMIPHFPLLSILYWSQVMNGVLLPLTMFFALRLLNDRALMGEHTNSPLLNVIARAAAAATGVASIVMVLTMVAPGLFR